MAIVRTVSDYIFLFIKGVAMGAANKVPGVSGGTVAFVTGFYEELIYSLQKVNRKAFGLLLAGRFKSFYQYLNGKFLLLVFAGSSFSYFSVSRVLDYFLQHYELFVWSTFFGMILGSIYYIAKDFDIWNKQNVITIVIGIMIGVAISFMDPAKENDNLFFVFLCGIIGVSGMTLPGLSGSFILILLGNYVLLLVDSVNELSHIIVDLFSGDFSFWTDDIRMRYLKIITTFTLGSIFGLVALSHVLGYLLKRWYQKVTSIILGFITGSLGIVWPWKKEIFLTMDGVIVLDSMGNKIIENYQRFLPNLSDVTNWYAIGFVLFGVLILLLIDRYRSEKVNPL